MHRFFIDVPLAAGTQVALDANAARHAQALRLVSGDAIVLFNGQGGEYVARLTFEGRKARAVATHHVPDDRTAPVAITLAQALLSSEKMDWVVQKATELGVTQIAPFAAARSTVRLDAERAGKRMEHWQGVVRAACEQCGMNRVPVIAPITPLATLLTSTQADHACRMTLAIGASASLTAQPRPEAGQSAIIVIGPEGDFAPEELRALDQAHFTRVSIGPRILRTETAGLAALAMLAATWRMV
jgi:16S rRNA (uracil1498-N3)-methyltransferase